MKDSLYKIISGILTLVLVFSFSVPRAEAALVLVQHKVNVNTLSGATVAVTVTSTGVGNLLVVATGNNGNHAVSKVCTDGGTCAAGNSFTQAVNAAGSNGTQATDVWYLLSAPSGATTVTITFDTSATYDKEAWVFEVSGFTNPAFDLANPTNNGVQAGGSATGAAVITTSTTGFVVGVDMTNTVVSANPKAGNEFTAGGDIDANSNAAASLISSTAASHQPVWTDNGSSFANSTAAFKESTNPTVTTSNTTTITSMFGNWNGNITDTGGFNSTAVGFEYGLTTSYGATTTKSGSFRVESFTDRALAPLTCATLYHFKAYATNSVGTGRSADATFTTLPCSRFQMIDGTFNIIDGTLVL